MALSEPHRAAASKPGPGPRPSVYCVLTVHCGQRHLGGAPSSLWAGNGDAWCLLGCPLTSSSHLAPCPIAACTDAKILILLGPDMAEQAKVLGMSAELDLYSASVMAGLLRMSSLVSRSCRRQLFNKPRKPSYDTSIGP